MMNPRADEGTIVLSEKNPITISDKEISEKIRKISNSGFELIKKQLEDKRQALLSEIQLTEALESKSHLYSTQLLQSTLMDNYRASLHDASLQQPLLFLKQKCLKDCNDLIKKIDVEHANIKEKMKSNLEISTGVAESLHQLETPLRLRVERLKTDFIQTLQNIASEYRDYLISNKEWIKKSPEFTDKFGCVCRIIGSLHPYEIDKTMGYGLQFGHVLRDKGELPSAHIPIDHIKKLKLQDIEKIINQVIQECVYYSKDTHVLHTMIKTHFEKLTRERLRDHSSDTKDFEFQEYGTFRRYLNTFVINKKEPELIDGTLRAHRQQLLMMEVEHAQSLAAEIKESIKSLEKALEQFKSSTDSDIRLIVTERNRTLEHFNTASLALSKHIESSEEEMKALNLEAKSLRLEVDESTHKVQLAYEDSLKAAKLLDKKGFEQQVKLASDQWTAATQAKKELDSKIKNLEGFELSINEKIKMGAKQFDGIIYKTLQPKCARETIKIVQLKRDVDASKRYMEEAELLPKAISVYGGITFDYAEARASIKNGLQSFAKIPEAMKGMWDAFYKMIDDAQAKINFRFHEYSNNASMQLGITNEYINKGAGDLAKAQQLTDTAEKKLQVAKAQFSPKIHNEHQENVDIVQMELTAALKQLDAEEKNLTTLKSMPDAIKEYSDILYQTSLMRDELLAIDRWCQTVATAKHQLELLKVSAEKSRKEGVVRKLFEEKAKKQWELAKASFDQAVIALKMAEAKKAAEEKKLEQANHVYPYDMQAKPIELFDAACTKYHKALASVASAKQDVVSIEQMQVSIFNEVKLAATVEKEKQVAAQLRQLILQTILFHLDVWPGKWGGGVPFHFMGKDAVIPHGVYELIKALNSSGDHKVWMANVIKVANDRDALARNSLKYFFKIRNDSTSALYRTLKNYLKCDERSLQLLTSEFKKIPGLHLEEKSSSLGRVVS